jgi:Ca2+-binding EF-hand superfamily protein
MLNFEDFLFVLRGRPNEERQAVIDYVYGIFDKEQKGVADANEMKKVFNCQKHPKFKMGKLTETQMFYLYLKNFNHKVKMTVTKKVSNILYNI